MARNRRQIYADIPQPVGFTIPWEIIFPLLIGLCPKKTPAEQHVWARNHQARAVNLTVKEILTQQPQLTRKEARVQARLAVDRYLASSDADIAVAAGAA